MNKGLIIRQSSANALFYYLRAIIDALNILWLFPLILSTEEIGLYKFITTSAYLIAYITQIGLPQGIVKYLPKFRDHKDSFWGFIIISTLSIFLFFVVLSSIFKNQFASLFKSKASAVIEHFNLILGTSFFLLLMMILKSWYRSIFKSTYPTFIQNVLIFFLMSISAILFHFKIINFNTLLYSIFYIYIIGFLLMFLHLAFIGEMKISFNLSSIKISFIKEFIFYNICTMVGTNGFSIITKIDAIMISYIIGLKFNGIYAIAVSIPKLIEIPRKAIKQLSVPLISNFINNEKWESINNIYKNMSLNQFIAGMFLFVIISLNIDHIFNIIPNQEIKESGKLIVFFLSLTKLIDTIMSIGNDIILMSKYFWFNIFSLMILAFFTIITNYLMIPIWGLIGAAAATAISFLIYNLSICVFVWIKTGLHPFTFNMIYVLILGIFSYLIFSLIPTIINDYFSILFKLLIFIPSYIFSLYIFNISPDFNFWIKNKLNIK